MVRDPLDIPGEIPSEEVGQPPEEFAFEVIPEEEPGFLTPTDMAQHLEVFHQRAEPSALPEAAILSLIEEIVGQAFNEAAIARAALAESLDTEVLGLRSDMNTSIASLASRIVTQQSEVAGSAAAQVAIDEEVGPGGVLGFIRSLPGFALAPIEALLERVGEYILSEVTDGLNR